jgi:hypothetical protein
MTLFSKHRILMAEEMGGEAPNGGAGGLGGDVAPPAEPTGDQAPPSEFRGPEWAKDLELDADILNDPALKAIGDINALTKSYVHAQRKIGQKGTLIPNENSTQEEWDTFYQKVGVPLEEQEYATKLELPTDGEAAVFDESFNQEFIKKAHELRVRPDQASTMYKFFQEQAANTTNNYMEEMQQKQQEQLDGLMNELGPEAYNVKLSKATKFIKEEVGEEFAKYLGESGLGKDANLVKAFMAAADKFYKEDKLPASPSNPSMTVSDIEKEINDAIGNPKDPYRNPAHPDHQRRVKEIQGYFAKLEQVSGR